MRYCINNKVNLKRTEFFKKRKVDKMSEYISIKEFSKKANVSVQAVYQRLERDLKQFVKLANNKKVISTEALILFSPKPPLITHNTTLITTLLEQIDRKDRQLSEKDKQIAEKDKQIKALTSALTNEQQHIYQTNTLYAVTIEQIKARENSYKPNFLLKWFLKNH